MVAFYAATLFVKLWISFVANYCHNNYYGWATERYLVHTASSDNINDLCHLSWRDTVQKQEKDSQYFEHDFEQNKMKK